MIRRGFLAGVLFALAGAVPAQTPLPFAVGGPFELTNQHGESRTGVSPDGHPQLLFFGYANCQNICSAALPLMATVSDLLAEDDISLTPVMITVAPGQDRVDTMDAPLTAIHPDFVGLTGDPDALQVAYDAFGIEIEPLFEDPEYGWVYAHGSFMYLLDADGAVLTLLPPVLDVDETARIIRTYTGPESGT